MFEEDEPDPVPLDDPDEGHAATVHCSTIIASPVHTLPPLLGAGLVQVLVLAECPVPHVTLHCVATDHAPQFPSTGTSFRMKIVHN